MTSKGGPLILIAAFLATLLCATADAQPQEQNLALHRPYRCSVPLMTGWTGLTDGEHDSDSAPECFATANVDTYPKYVVIDLGAVCTIQRVAVHNSGNGNTRKVSMEWSVDGQSFQTLREGFIFPDRTAQILSHQFEPRRARYVRLTFHDTWTKGLGGDHSKFLREIEVFGTAQDKPVEPDNPLAPYLGQAAGLSYPSLSIFRRYCLRGPTELVRVAVLGDTFAVADEEPTHWSVQLAELLEQQYEKQVELESAAAPAFSPSDCRRFAEQTDHDAADLVLLCVGHDAAIARLPVADFRGSTEQMIRALISGTEALVVLVTPMPIGQDPKLKMHEVTAGVDSRPYAWQLELLAQQHTIPLLRTGPALSAAAGQGFADLYADNLSLSQQGHEAVAAALDRLLAGR